MKYIHDFGGDVGFLRKAVDELTEAVRQATYRNIDTQRSLGHAQKTYEEQTQRVDDRGRPQGISSC